jgi:hypothetical protein
MFIERHSAALLHIAQSCINFEKHVGFGLLSPGNIRRYFFETFCSPANLRQYIFVLRPVFGHYFLGRCLLPNARRKSRNVS